ncbi:hypothetical protein VSDG_08634 [Cytospora chrysosperma]|uniref:DUF4470 domain-containing protein n=1 Tax=Cytospora chrysosperma TaxID=252740 RepID=A0A423VFF5_CYTCH|nr:hypothetical protein VSDG_08634 [Valsa sordida]
MVLNDLSAASIAARERGNSFYRAGNFNDAINAYKEAASLAPEDYAPLSNMSAVRFEMGRYPDAVEYAEKALQLLKSEPDDVPKKQKLYARIAKSLLYSLDFGKAELAKTAISRLDNSYSAEGTSVEALQSTIAGVKALWTSVPQEAQLRALVLDRLPRYKAHLLDCPEYYAVGHDEPSTVIDKPELQALPASQDDLSFLFCGSGDARNVFSTLLSLFQVPLVAKTSRFKKIHITILDLKPAALAKMIIIVDMLSRYSIMKFLKTKGHEDVLIVSSYVYCCQLLPPFVFEKMQEHIDHLIEALESGDDDPFPYLYVPPSSLRQVIRVLKQWKEPLSNHYSVPRARTFIRYKVKFNREQAEMYFGPNPRVPSKKDRKDFDAFGAIFADQDFIERREPRLGELYAAYESGDSVQMKDLEEYLDVTWKLNVTLLDSDHEATRNENLSNISEYYGSGCQAWSVNDGENPANLAEFDPVDMSDLFITDTPSGTVIKKMSVFFEGVTLGIIMLNEKLVIEAVVGEMADVMERLRYDAMDHRSLAPKDDEGIDPRQFPKKFDRIHMSNIPDYIGGPFTAFLSARPLLREQKQANMRFNNLLNPPMFDSHETFQAEYLLMPHEKQIAAHFAVVRERDPELSGLLDKMMPIPSFMQENYFIWNAVLEKPLSLGKRMRRQEFEAWIYGHLLKICLPYPRPLQSDRPVHAPLNLTMIFRLLERMSEVGYPAHWMSSILASICNGEIETKARAPRHIIVHRNDLSDTTSKKAMSVVPWRAEFTTLLSIWRRLLPFGVITPKHALVPLTEIVEYQVSFPIFREERLRLPHFTLVFWDTQCGQTPRDMRGLLMDEEEGDMFPSAKKTRNQGVHIVSAFRFVTHTRTASFWMRRDAVEDMKTGNWKLYIWRTDNWQAVTGAVDVSRDLRVKRSWLDVDEPQIPIS